MKPTLAPLTGAAALIDGRRSRLAAWFERANLDLLVCCSVENIQYATGYRSSPGSHRRHQRMAALTGGAGTLLVGPYAELPAAIAAGVDPALYVAYGQFFFASEDDQSWKGDVERHPDFSAALAAAVRRHGHADSIGIDAVDCSAACHAVLVDEFPTARIDDITHALHLVRSVKLPGEVERLRTVARLAEDGVDAALAALTTGVTERELASVVSTTMSAGGAAPRFVVVSTGLRSAFSDVFPADTPVEPGDLVRFDVGCTLDGYSSDIGRTAMLGEPTELQARRYAAIKAGEDRQLEECRPGLTAGELFDVAIEAVLAAGMDSYDRNHCGHGIGLETYEAFSVAAGEGHILEPGNVLCVETPFYELGWGGMMVEDALLVTANGAEVLTTSSRELRIIAS